MLKLFSLIVLLSGLFFLIGRSDYQKNVYVSNYYAQKFFLEKTNSFYCSTNSETKLDNMIIKTKRGSNQGNDRIIVFLESDTIQNKYIAFTSKTNFRNDGHFFIEDNAKKLFSQETIQLIIEKAFKTLENNCIKKHQLFVETIQKINE